jgi:type IV secretory pathway VirB3-like protein
MDHGIPKDMLYLACTRPAMKWGVPVEGLMINLGVSY